MELYHGTSLKRGKQILNEKVIRADAPKVYDDSHMFPTTKGYIYLTNDIINAIYYGNKTAFDDQDENLIVFCIDIDDSELEPDYDEIEYTLKFFNKTDGFKDINNPTLEESLKLAQSCRIKDNIDFKEYKVKYAIITSTYPINLMDKEKEYLSTIEVVSLRNTSNEFADNFKKEFISKLRWIEIN